MQDIPLQTPYINRNVSITSLFGIRENMLSIPKTSAINKV